MIIFAQPFNKCSPEFFGEVIAFFVAMTTSLCLDLVWSEI